MTEPRIWGASAFQKSRLHVVYSIPLTSSILHSDSLDSQADQVYNLISFYLRIEWYPIHNRLHRPWRSLMILTVSWQQNSIVGCYLLSPHFYVQFRGVWIRPMFLRVWILSRIYILCTLLSHVVDSMPVGKQNRFLLRCNCSQLGTWGRTWYLWSGRHSYSNYLPLRMVSR